MDFPEDWLRRSGRLSIQHCLEALIAGHVAQQLPAAAVSILAAYSAQVSLLSELLHGAKALERERLRKTRATTIRQPRG